MNDDDRNWQLVKNGPIVTEEDILDLKAALWATGHLGTSEAGVALLESASVVELFIRIASHSPVYALRGTAFYALNLVAMTTAGVDILSRLGASIFLFNILLVYSFWFMRFFLG